ncbi:MAG: NADH-quinone oxidoreductase subunit NuoF, partial [Nitrospirae bacterium]|nr:NADH-quinone oxidoreductase subunit NuoF [Nitrospirota bacterium]
MESREGVLLKYVNVPRSEDIGVALKHGAYAALPKAFAMSPQDLVETVKKAGLRGRGGAGFPTGNKWGFAAADPKKPKYLLCNADEGEPGTYKDRSILAKVPHLLIEGMIIGGYGIGAEYGYIYNRGEYPRETRILDQAIAQAYEKGYLGKNILGSGFNFDLYVHEGYGAYVCGEETALIESLEGKRGQARLKPPFPVNVGVWGKPTVVNNVETLANVPAIIGNGPDWFAAIGPKDCPGPKLYCISGHVNRPGIFELNMGVTYRELIYEYAGGIKNGRNLKAFIPGGASAACLTEQHLDTVASVSETAKAGSMLGSAALVVLDDTTCMVKVSWRLTKFFAHESCGWCIPCREGLPWIEQILYRLEEGHGSVSDVDLIMDLCDNIGGKT